MDKGLLITIEGIDGSGKHSQSVLLKEYLESKGKKVASYEFPNYNSFFGKVISRYLTGEFGSINEVSKELISIAYAADRVLVRDEFKKLIEDGYIIICDRYVHSNLFNAAKLNESERPEFISWIEELEFNQFNLIKPDLTLYLHNNVSITLDRISSRGKRDYQNGNEDIHENNYDLLFNASKCYLDYSNNPSNEWVNINQVVSDKQLSKEGVFELIKVEIDKIV